jgi:hypothetical protein
MTGVEHRVNNRSMVVKGKTRRKDFRLKGFRLKAEGFTFRFV